MMGRVNQVRLGLTLLAVSATFLGFQNFTKPGQGVVKSARQTLAHQGQSRSYLLHLPVGYSASKKYPVVFLFHGGNGTPEKIIEQTKFNAKADAEGFILVAPAGLQETWNNGVFHEGSPQANTADDVGFVRALLKDLQKKHSIDADRIYATGASNGGMFVQRLGCEMSDVLAAIGPEIGPLVDTIAANCRPDPISVINIQGVDDPLVPFFGGPLSGLAAQHGDRATVLSAEAVLMHWAGVNRCLGNAVSRDIKPRVQDGTSVQQFVFPRCTSGKDVHFHIVFGMGHAWPPTAPQTGLSGKTSQNLNATDVIWDFFKTRSKSGRAR